MTRNVRTRTNLVVKFHAKRCKLQVSPAKAHQRHSPIQIVFVGSKYLPRLGDVPDLGILILDLCGRQELDGLSLEENLAMVV